MAFKFVILCVSALLIQCIAGQRICSSRDIPSNCGCAYITLSDDGGPLAVTSISPVAPSGIAIATDLGLSGDLDLTGTLPYLSAVSFEGQFDTKGSTPVSYGCGNCVAITQGGNTRGYNDVFSAGINNCGNGAASGVTADINLARTLPTVTSASGNCAAIFNVDNRPSITGPALQGLSTLSGCGCTNPLVPNSGGDLPVTSISPVPPSMAMASDLGLCGELDLYGTVPFLSAVTFEGSCDTRGAAGVSYGCGNGCIGINNIVGQSSGFNGFNGCGYYCG